MKRTRAAVKRGVISVCVLGVVAAPATSRAQAAPAADRETVYGRGSAIPDPELERERERERERVAERERRVGRRFALWSSPVLTGYAAIAPFVTGNSGFGGRPSPNVNINLGTTISLQRGVDLFVHVGVTLSPPPADGFFPSGGLRPSFGFSIGPQFLLTGDRRLNGFFVAPKLDVSVSTGSGYSSAMSFYVGPGLDVGYEVTLGGLHVAFVTGFSTTIALTPGFGASAHFGPVVNLTGLRLGGAL